MASSAHPSTNLKLGRMPTKLRWALQGMNFVDLLAVGFVEPLVTPLAKKHGASPVMASAIGSTYGLFQVRKNRIKRVTLPRVSIIKGGSDFEAYPLPSSRLGSSSSGENFLSLSTEPFL